MRAHLPGGPAAAGSPGSAAHEGMGFAKAWAGANSGELHTFSAMSTLCRTWATHPKTLIETLPDHEQYMALNWVTGVQV